MSEPFIGEIRLFGFNFAPVGWALCNGQLLPIAQNTALFSLLGTTYGGNGQTTFALPDLRGRAPMHMGTGPGLSPYNIGQQGGTETVTLLTSQIPAHNHLISCSTDDPNAGSPAGKVLAAVPSPIYADTANATMAPNAVSVAGSSQPHPNLPPYLVLNYCIALQGIYPARS